MRMGAACTDLPQSRTGLGGHPDVCYVQPGAGLLAYDLLQLPGGALGLDGLFDYPRHDLARNLWRPTASGKIPEAVKASGIEAFQPGMHLPVGPHEVGFSLAYAHFAHANHVYGKHPEDHSGIIFFSVRFFQLFPLCNVHDVAVREGIIIAFDLADLP